MRRLSIEDYKKRHCGDSYYTFASRFNKQVTNIHKTFREKDKDRYVVITDGKRARLARETNDGDFLVIGKFIYEIMGDSEK